MFDDVIPALEELASCGWQHVILSNHVPELDDMVRYLGLRPYLVRVFNSARTGYEKPHPRSFQIVVDSFPGSDQFWMIGDSMRADVAGAEAVGTPAILVRRPHPDAQRYCESLYQVPAILRCE